MTATATVPSELRVARTFADAETLIQGGVDSSRVVVLHGQDEATALRAASEGIAAGRGPLPSRPHDVGKRCLVVVPTYNERENAAAILRDIRAYLQTDVLVVDDGSPDGTAAIVREVMQRDAGVHLLERSGKQGLGTAYLAGFAWAGERGYDRVFEMDADFSHPPWDLPRLAAASLHAALAIGSRYVRGGSTSGWDFKRRLLSRNANRYAGVVLGMRVRDLTAGFRCYDVGKLLALDLAQVAAQGYAFQIEMAYRMARAGHRIVEIPIHFSDRRMGHSKMNTRIAVEALLLVPKLRLSRVGRK